MIVSVILFSLPIHYYYALSLLLLVFHSTAIRKQIMQLNFFFYPTNMHTHFLLFYSFTTTTTTKIS